MNPVNQNLSDSFRYQTLIKNVLGQQGNPVSQPPQIDCKAYARHILKDGSRDEKRELLSCLKNDLFIKDQKVYLDAAYQV